MTPVRPDPSKLELIQQLLESAEGNVKSAKQLLTEVAGGTPSSLRERAKELGTSGDGRVVEGVFDGQNMVGSDGKKYPVPANYASKSKLVEGDVLKLTILDDGSFIYKQIGPVERRKVVGTLAMDGEEYRVLAGDRSYKVLYASVTYFKGKPGDQVTLIIPKDKESTWAAVENILPAGQEAAEAAASVPPQPITPLEDTPGSPAVAEPDPAPATPPEVTITPEAQTAGGPAADAGETAEAEGQAPATQRRATPAQPASSGNAKAKEPVKELDI